MAKRKPVNERGVSLLALIAAEAAGYLMLTQDEGVDAVNAGDAIVDASITDGDTAAVRLTDQGRATLAAAGNGGNNDAGAAAGASSFSIDDGVAIPSGSTRGRSGGYPFDKLEIGQSFHVPMGKDDKEPADVATRLQSSVSGARARYAEPTGETETVTVKTFQRGPDGKGYAKGADGKRIVTATTTEQRPKLRHTRNFMVKPVDASDPRGVGARVWRVALSN